MRQKLDNTWLGLAIGLLLPAAFALLYIDRTGLWYALQHLNIGQGSVLSRVTLVSAFPNMALLFIFYHIETWHLARGTLAATLLYLLLCLLLLI